MGPKKRPQKKDRPDNHGKEGPKELPWDDLPKIQPGKFCTGEKGCGHGVKGKEDMAEPDVGGSAFLRVPATELFEYGCGKEGSTGDGKEAEKGRSHDVSCSPSSGNLCH